MLSHITNKSGIYKITSPSGKVYVGESINIRKRFLKYKNLNCKYQIKLYNSLNKYGYENHIFEVIEECYFDDLLCRERYWQDFYNVLSDRGMNLKLTSCGDTKQVFSHETNNKRSETFRKNRTSEGVNNPMYGKKHTHETKDKISEAHKGKYAGNKNPQFGKFGKDHPAFGNKATLEQLQHAREINLFGKNPQAKIVIDKETGVFYESASELAYIWGINKYNLRARLNGALKNNTSFEYC